MLRDFRQHLLSPCHPSAPKTPPPRASHPAVMGSGQGHPRSGAGMGPPRRGGRGGGGLGVTYSSRKISTNFPNLLELSFLTVLALPKDSSKGVASRICPRPTGRARGEPTARTPQSTTATGCPHSRDPPCAEPSGGATAMLSPRPPGTSICRGPGGSVGTRRERWRWWKGEQKGVRGQGRGQGDGDKGTGAAPTC